MPFSNPATATATATATALTNGVDYFYWPTFSGEQFPPTLGAGSAYSAFGTRPGLRANAGGATTTTTWPILPRIAPAHGTTLDTVTCRFFFAWDNHTFFSQGVLTIGSGLTLDFRSDQWCFLTDTVTSINIYPSMSAGGWHEFVVTVAPGGVLTWTLDSVAQTGFTLTGAGAAFDGNALRPSLATFGNGVSNTYLSGLRYDWTA